MFEPLPWWDINLMWATDRARATRPVSLTSLLCTCLIAGVSYSYSFSMYHHHWHLYVPAVICLSKNNKECTRLIGKHRNLASVTSVWHLIKNTRVASRRSGDIVCCLFAGADQRQQRTVLLCDSRGTERIPRLLGDREAAGRLTGATHTENKSHHVS